MMKTNHRYRTRSSTSTEPFLSLPEKGIVLGKRKRRNQDSEKYGSLFAPGNKTYVATVRKRRFYRATSLSILQESNVVEDNKDRSEKKEKEEKEKMEDEYVYAAVEDEEGNNSDTWSYSPGDDDRETSSGEEEPFLLLFPEPLMTPPTPLYHCVICREFMGEMNPRQYCCKTHCPCANWDAKSLHETQWRNFAYSEYVQKHPEYARMAQKHVAEHLPVIEDVQAMVRAHI